MSGAALRTDAAPPQNAVASPSGGGLVIDGRRYVVPGVNVVSWLDDPTRAPKVTDGWRRGASKVEGFVLHTSRGKMAQVKPGARPSTKDEALALYQARTKRAVSWHLTVGTDGDVYQQADLSTWMCFHAETANGWTVGLELAQHDDDASLYQEQLDAMVAVVAVACEVLSIPKRVMVDAAGRPVLTPVPALVLKKHGGAREERFEGVLAHANLVPATIRGPGDCGPAPLEALLRAGFEGVPAPR